MELGGAAVIEVIGDNLRAHEFQRFVVEQRENQSAAAPERGEEAENEGVRLLFMVDSVVLEQKARQLAVKARRECDQGRFVGCAGFHNSPPRIVLGAEVGFLRIADWRDISGPARRAGKNKPRLS